jgi:hypothetical protein
MHMLISERHKQKQKHPESKGFQRTPAFVVSVIKDAVPLLQQAASVAPGLSLCGFSHSLPRGGFTDVGLHTGHAAARDTSWPLVREVLKVRVSAGAPALLNNCLCSCID